MDIIISFDRYLVWYELFLTNIDQSHPGAKELLNRGGIAVTRSLIPGALSVVDKTMEETFMKAPTTQTTSGGAVTVVSSCCANCVEPPHADTLDGWRCCSQKRVISKPIQVRQL